jgi:hypothetical protein
VARTADSGGETRDTLAAILRAMITDPAVLTEVATAARTSPEVARLPIAENLRHIQVLLASGLAGFERPDVPDAPDTPDVPEDDPTATRLGADRAEQGVPLTALLRGVHAGRIRALQIGVERGRAAGVPDAVLLDALLLFDRHAGAMERQVIAGYHAAELERARTSRDERTQVLRRLLHAEPGPAPGPEELRRAGLRPEAAYRCVLADVADPVRARALERRLTAPDAVFGLVDGRFAGLLPESAGTPPTHPRAPGAGSGPAGGTDKPARPTQRSQPTRPTQPERPTEPREPAGSTNPVAPENPTHPTRAADSPSPTRLTNPAHPTDSTSSSADSTHPTDATDPTDPTDLVIIGPAVSLAALPDTHRLCADALEAARAAGATGPHLLTDLAAETALAARPDLAATLAGELLGRLDPADAFHRELARTALTFLDLGHRLDLTAAALHLHPNTVRYRLAKLSRLASPPPATRPARTPRPAPAPAPAQPPTAPSPAQEWDDPRLLPTLRWWWALRTWLATATPAAPGPLTPDSPPRPGSPAPGRA